MTTNATPMEGEGFTGSVPFPLQAEERIIKLCRRHWISLVQQELWYALIGLVPVALLVWLESLFGSYDGEGFVHRIFYGILLVWLVFWIGRALLAWYQYHNDIWVITNQRLIDAVKRHPLNLAVSTADLVNIQDLSIERRGILATMFGFGDIVCQTAGNSREFRLRGIPQPQDVQLLIDKERDRERMRYR